MVKNILVSLYLAVSLLLFAYLAFPFGPKVIDDFSDLPLSIRSKLSGDTVQVSNLKAFYSNYYRNYVTDYYRNEYWTLSKLPFPPLRLNYPPEYAYTAIKDQTQSTYLEEYSYPFRGSLFVNGLEPFDEITKAPRYPASSYFVENGITLETKVVIRYYPTNLLPRLFVWVGINISVIALFIVGKKILRYA